MKPEQAEELAFELGEEYYMDVHSARVAIQSSRSFNIIHVRSSYKFDLFPLLPHPYHLNALARRRDEIIQMEAESVQVPVASPEDVLLNKMLWYQAGGAVSENQWRDIRGILDARGSQLDWEYLKAWAREPGVELLAQAAGGDSLTR